LALDIDQRQDVVALRFDHRDDRVVVEIGVLY
jgi:hypothetical protein